MRVALAILLLLHGLAHIVGVIGAWDLAPEKVPRPTALLGGVVEAGVPAMQVMGLIWLVLALGFSATAAAALADTGPWAKAALAFSVVSLVMSTLALPDARVGIFVNVAIIAAIAAGRAYHIL